MVAKTKILVLKKVAQIFLNIINIPGVLCIGFINLTSDLKWSFNIAYSRIKNEEIYI